VSRDYNYYSYEKQDLYRACGIPDTRRSKSETCLLCIATSVNVAKTVAQTLAIKRRVFLQRDAAVPRESRKRGARRGSSSSDDRALDIMNAISFVATRRTVRGALLRRGRLGGRVPGNRRGRGRNRGRENEKRAKRSIGRSRSRYRECRVDVIIYDIVNSDARLRIARAH